jgi:hypothetical protein
MKVSNKILIIVSLVIFLAISNKVVEFTLQDAKVHRRIQIEKIRPLIDNFMAGEEVNPDIFSWYNRTHRKVDTVTLEHYLNEGLITEEEHQAFLGAHLEVRWSRKDAVATAK